MVSSGEITNGITEGLLLSFDLEADRTTYATFVSSFRFDMRDANG